jgi:uncharacterized protein YndB with AHSA1/START domain
MNELAKLDAYSALSDPAALTIQRILPGPIVRVWAYLTESGFPANGWRRVNGDEGRHAFELVWRNSELTGPPRKRPGGFGEEHRLQSQITELDPPRKLAFTWGKSGGVTFELEPRGERCCSPSSTAACPTAA